MVKMNQHEKQRLGEGRGLKTFLHLVLQKREEISSMNPFYERGRVPFFTHDSETQGKPKLSKLHGRRLNPDQHYSSSSPRFISFLSQITWIQLRQIQNGFFCCHLSLVIQRDSVGGCPSRQQRSKEPFKDS
jgi:hypothetical protein